MEILDYYEFLQISPNADADTIHRVYRFLAARYHPDNPETADAEKFFLLTQAYSVLSSPERRDEYDASRKNGTGPAVPLSSSIDFMDNVKGEINKRLAVLAVLYFQRRANPYAPEVSFLDIEARLGFPREYLEFTTWYLRRKGYVERADNADFTLTVEGVDFVETQRVNIPLLNKLLTMGEGRLGPVEAHLSSTARQVSPSVSDLPPKNGNAPAPEKASDPQEASEKGMNSII